MANTDPASLLAQAQCYDCAGLPWQLLQLGLLKQLVLLSNPVADLSPQALMNQVSCYACLSPGQWQLLSLAMLSLLVQAGGTGGGSCLLCGTVNPTTAPSCTCAIYYNRATGGFWDWDSDLNQWVQFLG
jgi:hypothetical protein